MQQFLIVIGTGLLSLGLSLWQVTRPELVGVYDSGVYLAASIRLISGALPYRDFVFVQPPGILVCLSPAAVFSRIFGTHDGLIFARVMTSFVSAANVSLLCLLVRHRGRAAMLIAGLGLALAPIAVDISSALFLEQYVVFFLLLGALVILSPLTSRPRLTNVCLVLGGVLFGFAGLIKVWAFFPFVAMVLCVAVTHRKRVVLFAGAACASFVAIALPFFLSAPYNFVHQVLVDQLTRKPYWGDSASVVQRLAGMTGFGVTQFAPSTFDLAVIFVALLGIVVLAYTRRVSRNDTDLFLLGAAVLAAGGILAGPVYYPHYSAFVIPFLVGLLAVSVGRVGQSFRSRTHGVIVSDSMRRFATWTVAVAGTGLLIGMTMWATVFYASIAEPSTYASLNEISQIIPPGACVIYDDIGYGILEGRFFSNDAACPQVVDPTGTRLLSGNEVTSPTPQLIRQWKSYFEAAQYVVLDRPELSAIPLNGSLLQWFHRNYHVLYSGNYLQIYEHGPSS